MACGRYDRVAGYRPTGTGRAVGDPYPFQARGFQVLISPGTVGGDGSVLQLMAGDGELQDDLMSRRVPKVRKVSLGLRSARLCLNRAVKVIGKTTGNPFG